MEREQDTGIRRLLRRIDPGTEIVLPVGTSLLATAVNFATDLQDNLLAWGAVAVLTLATPLGGRWLTRNRVVARGSRSAVDVCHRQEVRQRFLHQDGTQTEMLVNWHQTATITVTDLDNRRRAEILAALVKELR